jgi:hypothetical protein
MKATLSLAVILASALLSAPAFAAAPPTVNSRTRARQVDKTIREVAGSSEYLRSVPKRFALLKGIDLAHRRVTLQFEGEHTSRDWPLIDDAEIKIDGWWGRLDQLTPGERVWVWMKTNRKKESVAVAMLADDLSQQDIHGVGVTVVKNTAGRLVVKPETGANRNLVINLTDAFRGEKKGESDSFTPGSKVFVKSLHDRAMLLLDPPAFELRRALQRQALRKRWLEAGLPGSVSFVHVFSGEMDLTLDHETMRWARSLKRGDKVTLRANPPITAVVKSVRPWRERTQVRLVAKSQELADLHTGQRLELAMKPPPPDVENGKYPPDIDHPRSAEERIDWFLASVYCTCGVRGNTCTGHFYTLASCNPNGCGQPNAVRKQIAGMIAKGLSDRQIFDKLLQEHGLGLTQPHLLP